MGKNKIMKIIELECICMLIQKKLKNKDYNLVLYDAMNTKDHLEYELAYIQKLIVCIKNNCVEYFEFKSFEQWLLTKYKSFGGSVLIECGKI